jgi:hypothetical protein
LPPSKEKEFADILDQNLDFVADDSVLSSVRGDFFWKEEAENAPAFLPPTLGVPPCAAGASTARGGELPALPVGPSIGGGQATAASIAWPPRPPVPGVAGGGPVRRHPVICPRRGALNRDYNRHITGTTMYPPYNFLHFSPDFSREKFFSTFHTNFLEKIFSRGNSCQFFLLDFSRDLSNSLDYFYARSHLRSLNFLIFGD